MLKCTSCWMFLSKHPVMLKWYCHWHYITSKRFHYFECHSTILTREQICVYWMISQSIKHEFLKCGSSHKWKIQIHRTLNFAKLGISELRGDSLSCIGAEVKGKRLQHKLNKSYSNCPVSVIINDLGHSVAQLMWWQGILIAIGTTSRWKFEYIIICIDK